MNAKLIVLQQLALLDGESTLPLTTLISMCEAAGLRDHDQIHRALREGKDEGLIYCEWNRLLKHDRYKATPAGRLELSTNGL